MLARARGPMQLTRFSQVGLVDTAHHLPPRIVHTRDAFECPDDLIRLTGVQRRHVVGAGEATSDLLVAACRPLVHHPIARILVATMTGDHPSPATAPLVQHGLGLPSVPALDVQAACAGFVYALDLAARCVLTGDAGVLVAAGECRSVLLEGAPPGVQVLFGDGAGAAWVGPMPEGAGGLLLRATMLGAEGAGHGAVRVEAGGSRVPTTAQSVREGRHALRMRDGAEVFFEAVAGLTEIAQAFLAGLGMTSADVDLVVPHQPNLRILERVARLLRIPLERFALEVETLGNVGGASAAIALDRARRAGRIRPGMRILLLTAGAGYTAGAAWLEAR